ncbi:MAG: ABC transporter permease [Patescibacteria group bacterium]|nr:ABC transporter permease [Patescibacteria group bacterium]
MLLDLSYYSQIFKTLKAHKMRSFLTSLGIIIGISSVIIIMSGGAGAQNLVFKQVEGIGVDLLGILPGASDDSGPPAAVMGINITTLVNDDIRAIESQVPEIIAATGYVRGVAILNWQNKSRDSSFLGVSPNYLRVETGAEVASGYFFSEEDDRSLARVAVIGSLVATDLFGNVNPLGERIRINDETFRIIGVMKERGMVGFQNQDDQVFIPIATAQRIMLGINYLSFARAKIAPGADADVVVAEVEAILRDRHNIDDPKDDDFSVRSAEQGLDVLTDITNALNYFLGAVAAISLLVGGIGIMNIMLVSVSESTREIGLRKAVGARRRDISRHFLIQTLILTALGGIIGIFSGIFISFLISVIAKALGYDWEFIIPLSSIILATSFTLLVALAFGWYPAQKAAKLDPIDALRYE